MGVVRLSPSSLNLLGECPRCFWLRIVKKVKRPAGVFPSLPSGMDLIVKKHFDKCRARGEMPPELKRTGIEAELFPDLHLLKKWREPFKGIVYKDEESGVMLRGAVDDVLQRNGKLIVLDFKTRGYALKEDTAQHYQDQLNIYNFLLRKNGYETEDCAYLLFFVPEEINLRGDVVFDTNLVRMDVNVGHAEELFEKAINILKGNLPECSEECGYCKWVGNYSDAMGQKTLE